MAFATCVVVIVVTVEALVAFVAFVTAVAPICPTISAAEATATALVPEPLSNAPEVKDVAPVPPEATARVDDSPAAVPVVFWFNVGNVQFTKLPLAGVPSAGLVSVGLFSTGLVSVGTNSVGLLDKTVLPMPVDVVTPVPPAATGSVPVTPVVKGKPVALVSTAEDGVPRAGVTNEGLVASTTLPDPVEVVAPVPPLATGKAVPDKLIAKVPELVIGLPATLKNAGTEAATLVTVPVVLEVPAPMAVRNVAASSALTVLSALNRGKVTALGSVRVNRLLPTVVAPKFVLAFAAVDAPVPPSAIAKSVARVRDDRWSFWNVKLVPSDQTVTVLPAGMATPVPAAVVLPITVEL